MHPWGFVIEQLTHGDERLLEERRRHARRAEARSARNRRKPPRALGERLDG
ncbi:MAG: hypothetical protein ABWX84_08750 [Nocardioides sp.]